LSLVLSSSSIISSNLSPVYPVSPESLDFVFDFSKSSGDNLSETGDKLSKYGDKTSVSGEMLCSPELPELFFSIFIIKVFVIEPQFFL